MRSRCYIPDLVVSDLRLGEESGVELCARVRKEIGSLKFMLYTVAQITAEDRAHAKEAGVDIFVHRPVKMSEFLEVIAGLVERG